MVAALFRGAHGSSPSVRLKHLGVQSQGALLTAPSASARPGHPRDFGLFQITTRTCCAVGGTGWGTQNHASTILRVGRAVILMARGRSRAGLGESWVGFRLLEGGVCA